MEYDALCLNFSVFDVDFVATENNRYVLADADQIPVPVGYIFVRYSGCNVKHNYGALSLNVVTITETTKLLLTSGIPHVEANRATIGMKDQWMYLHSQSCDVLLLEFTGQMTFDEGGLAGTAVADQDALESGHIGFLCHLDRMILLGLIATNQENIRICKGIKCK